MDKNSELEKEKISNNITQEEYNQKLDAEIKEELRKVEEYNAKLDAEVRYKLRKLAEGKSNIDWEKANQLINESLEKRLYYSLFPNEDITNLLESWPLEHVDELVDRRTPEERKKHIEEWKQKRSLRINKINNK